MALYSLPLNFGDWIEDHRGLLRLPAHNAQIWTDTDFIVTVVGGPKLRSEFHDDPFEEFFYQLSGDIVLRVREDDRLRDIPIRAGEIFLLPPHVRHSPQRPISGSVGLVIERKRPDEVRDGFEWFCPACSALVHRVELLQRNIVKDLPQLFDAFYASNEKRTCRNCSAVHPGKAARAERVDVF